MAGGEGREGMEEGEATETYSSSPGASSSPSAAASDLTGAYVTSVAVLNMCLTMKLTSSVPFSSLLTAALFLRGLAGAFLVGEPSPSTAFFLPGVLAFFEDVPSPPSAPSSSSASFLVRFLEGVLDGVFGVMAVAKCQSSMK